MKVSYKSIFLSIVWVLSICLFICLTIAFQSQAQVPVKTEDLLIGPVNKQDIILSPVSTLDETFSYYEKFATGIRPTLTRWETEPCNLPFVSVIRKSLETIDNLVIAYRDFKTLPLENRPPPSVLGEWLDELYNQACIINKVQFAITKSKGESQ